MYLYFDTEPFKSRGLPTPEELGQTDRNTMSVDWVRSWRVVPELNGRQSNPAPAASGSASDMTKHGDHGDVERAAGTS